VAALTIFQTGTFTTGAKLTAVVFTVFDHASAQTKLAIAAIFCTFLFRHGNYLLRNITSKKHANHMPMFFDSKVLVSSERLIRNQ
jgi:hypothetical protein